MSDGVTAQSLGCRGKAIFREYNLLLVAWRKDGAEART
jgi:hypothetical protein